MGKLRRSLPSWRLVTDLALLCLMLLGVAWSAVSAYHITVIDSAIWLGVLAIAILSLVMARFPALSLPVLALWGVGVWRLWDELRLGGARLKCDVVNTMAAKVPSVQSIHPTAQIPDHLWPWMTTLWLMVVGVVFGYVLALLLCRGRWAAPVILWTVLPILPALCVTEAPAPLPMGTLLVVWVTLLLTSAVARRDPRGAARLRPVALCASVLALAILLAAMPTQGTSQPVWAARIRVDTINAARRMDLSRAFSGWRGSKGSGSTEYVSLTGGGAPGSTHTALRVRGAPAGKYYLRGWSTGVYTSTRWEPLSDDAQDELEDIMSTGFQPLLMLQQRLEQADAILQGLFSSRHPTVDTASRVMATMTVENVSAPGGCVYYPYALASAPESAALLDDAHLSRKGWGWEHTITFDPNVTDGWGVAMTAATHMMAWAEQDPAEQRYQAFVYNNYLDIPAQLSAQLEGWKDRMGMDYRWALEEYIRGYRSWSYAAAGKGYSPSGDQAPDAPVTDADRARFQPQYAMVASELVAALLAREAEYDKEVPAPPKGEDYVNWFLNESKRGYCMHFASAGVMLMRSLGVPARYVSGYVVKVPASGEATVPDKAAHAWGEIWVDGFGWYPVEFTPAFRGRDMGDLTAEDFGAAARPTPTPTSDPAATATPAPDAAPTPTASGAPAPTATARPVPGQKGRGGGLPGWAWPWVGGVTAAALLAGAIALRRWILRRRARRMRGEDANAAVIWAYRCHRRLEPWGGQEDPALTALAEKARFSQHTLTKAERAEAAACYRREKARVRAQLKGWKKPLFDLWFGKT